MYNDKLQNCSLNQSEYLHYDISETEVDLNISVNNGTEKL
jgi:hypothetical protein